MDKKLQPLYHEGENNWTMVYDEGFEVTLGNFKLFFFNLYYEGGFYNNRKKVVIFKLLKNPCRMVII